MSLEVIVQPKAGCPRKTSPRQDNSFLQVCKNNVNSTYSDILQELKACFDNINVIECTVYNLSLIHI